MCWISNFAVFSILATAGLLRCLSLGQCQKGRMLRAPGKSQAPDLQSGAPPMAVHLDMDSILFQPLHELFDAMYYQPTNPNGLDARPPSLAIHATFTKLLTGCPHLEHDHQCLLHQVHDQGRLCSCSWPQWGLSCGTAQSSRLRSHCLAAKGGHLHTWPLANGTGWYGSNYNSHIWGIAHHPWLYCITTASLLTPHLWNCTSASSIKWQTIPRNPPVRGITVPPLLEIPYTRRPDTTTSSARMVVKIVTTSNSKHGHSLKSDRDITHFVPNRGRVPIPCLAFPSTKKAAERCCENGFKSDTTLLQRPTCQQPSFIGMERTIQMCILDIVARLDLAVMFVQ